MRCVLLRCVLLRCVLLLHVLCCCIKTGEEPTVVKRLPTEEADAVEEEDGEAKEQVLVEEEGHHAGDAGVGPAAMHQQQSLQKAELSNAEVTAHDCLHTLLPTDPHSCMASENGMCFQHPISLDQIKFWVM